MVNVCNTMFALKKCLFLRVMSVAFVLLGISVFVFHSSWSQMIIEDVLALKKDSQTLSWFIKSPVTPVIKIYIYNVTNADDILNSGSKPVLDELGPYVYNQIWEKVDVKFYDNDTLSFKKKTTYIFDEANSFGSESDVVIFPNIPMLGVLSLTKNASPFYQLASAAILETLKVKHFVKVSVGELFWGYNDPIIKMANKFLKDDEQLPYDEFGIFYGKNGTSDDKYSIYSGASDMKKYGLINDYNGQTKYPHYSKESCSKMNGSDGSMFPPGIEKSTTLNIFAAELCRLLPLKFEKEIVTPGGLSGYRFSPEANVFSSPEMNPENSCFCSEEENTCPPNGILDISPCFYKIPMLISFPHFYLADDSLLTAVEGISPPDPNKHKFQIDVLPETGTIISAHARIQINFKLTSVTHLKNLPSFPEIIFPLVWFEQEVDNLPKEISDLLKMYINALYLSKYILGCGFILFGILLALMCTIFHVKSSEKDPKDIFDKNTKTILE